MRARVCHYIAEDHKPVGTARRIFPAPTKLWAIVGAITACSRRCLIMSPQMGH